MKENYSGKFVELDFSQNLSLRLKDEVQSAHFSGKQFPLHCAIVEPVEDWYHYHLSNDTKLDGIFVDQLLRDMISVYEIQNKDLWIQSYNAPSQYNNKIPFVLLQQLANEVNLRIIRTYGTAGHGEEVINAMSSFSAKNVPRRDIITHDVFFNQSENIVDYLTVKNPHYYDKNISTETVAKARME